MKQLRHHLMPADSRFINWYCVACVCFSAAIGNQLLAQQNVEVTGNLIVSDSAHIMQRLQAAQGVFGTSVSDPAGILDVQAEAAALVLDQAQETGMLVNNTDGEWQSFTASISGELHRVSLFFDGVSNLPDYRLRIYEGEGTGGALLADNNYSFGSGSNVWRNFNNLGIQITAGSTYTWRIDATSVYTPGIEYSDADPYPGGQASLGPGSDFQFRTHVFPQSGSGLRVGQTGLVGINVDSATTHLDVDGQIRMRQGATAGSIPVSNAEGVMSWADPSEVFQDDWSNSGDDIYYNPGNVGILTDNPSGVFQIGEACSGAGQLHVSQTQSTTQDASTTTTQTFTMETNGCLNQVKVYVNGQFVSPPNSAHVTLKLKQGVATLFQQEISAPSLPAFATWNLPNVQVESGIVYTLVITRTETTCSGFPQTCNTNDVSTEVYHSNVDAYPGGQMGSDPNADIHFQVFVKPVVGFEAFVVDQSLNTGVGTLAPTEKLDVAGQIRMRTGAANGRVPVSNADGVMTWTNPSTIESDPVFSGSPAAGIAGSDISDWDDAHSWGDHATAGYISSESDPTVAMTTSGRVPRWSGSALLDGAFYDNGTMVSIGNQTPVGKLTIVDTMQNSLTIKTYDNAINTGIAFQNSGNSYSWNLFRNNVGANTSDFVVAGGTINNTLTALPERLRIASNGNLHVDNNTLVVDAVNNRVGIGSGSPTEALTVDAGMIIDAGTLYADATNNRVGIGTTSPDNKLDVEGAVAIGASYSGSNTAPSNGLIVQGDVGIGTSSPAHALHVVGNAGKSVGGQFWAVVSDARLKDDIRPYEGGLQDILAIRPVRFRYNDASGFDTGIEQVGVVAQELQQIAPEMVSEIELNGGSYLNVDSSPMLYMLINAVQELSAEKDALHALCTKQQEALEAQRQLTEELLQRVQVLEGSDGSRK